MNNHKLVLKLSIDKSTLIHYGVYTIYFSFFFSDTYILHAYIYILTVIQKQIDHLPSLRRYKLVPA